MAGSSPWPATDQPALRRKWSSRRRRSGPASIADADDHGRNVRSRWSGPHGARGLSRAEPPRRWRPPSARQPADPSRRRRHRQVARARAQSGRRRISPPPRSPTMPVDAPCRLIRARFVNPATSSCTPMLCRTRAPPELGVDRTNRDEVFANPTRSEMTSRRPPFPHSPARLMQMLVVLCFGLFLNVQATAAVMDGLHFGSQCETMSAVGDAPHPVSLNAVRGDLSDGSDQLPTGHHHHTETSQILAPTVGGALPSPYVAGRRLNIAQWDGDTVSRGHPLERPPRFGGS